MWQAGLILLNIITLFNFITIIQIEERNNMQTIPGAKGQIAQELAKELYRNYTTDIRLASRNPKKINYTDQLFPANLLDADATAKAVKGSDIAYLTPLRFCTHAADVPTNILYFVFSISRRI